MCEKVLITDINEGPIEVARRRIEAAGFSEVCRFMLTDGLDAIEPEEGDVVLISGLGGENIARIIERGYRKLSLIKRLILQPQTKEDVLRETVHRLPLTLLDERIAVEDRRPYLVMVYNTSTHTSAQLLSDIDIAFGPKILERIGGLVQNFSKNELVGKGTSGVLMEMSNDTLIASCDRARIVYMIAKYDKIVQRARFQTCDQLLLRAVDEWFSSHVCDASM